MADEKITVQNIKSQGRTENLRADKYHDMRAALMEALPQTPPGLSFNDLKEAAKPHLSPKLFPNGKTSGWWAKSFQLDLEAKGLIMRTKSKPLKFYKTCPPLHFPK